jgi:hypothetical protein
VKGIVHLSLLIGLITLPLVFASRAPRAMPVNFVLGTVVYAFFLIFVEPRLPG